MNEEMNEEMKNWIIGIMKNTVRNATEKIADDNYE